jgi:hypothetical protein
MSCLVGHRRRGITSLPPRRLDLLPPPPSVRVMFPRDSRINRPILRFQFKQRVQQRLAACPMPVFRFAVRRKPWNAQRVEIGDFPPCADQGRVYLSEAGNALRLLLRHPLKPQQPFKRVNAGLRCTAGHCRGQASGNGFPLLIGQRNVLQRIGRHCGCRFSFDAALCWIPAAVRQNVSACLASSRSARRGAEAA